jgi:hypothetical protein
VSFVVAFLDAKVTVFLQKILYSLIILYTDIQTARFDVWKYFYTGKEGPIYSVEWSPKSSEFCVVYGYMPSKATLFNLKCEPVFEFGTGPRNCTYYNPHGNNILFCVLMLFIWHNLLICSWLCSLLCELCFG